MGGSFWLGIAVISISGIFNGIFALPLKHSREWRWENSWLLFEFFGLLILPWGLAISFVPNLWEVFARTPSHVLLIPLGFGLLLGIAQVMYGLGIVSVGIGVTIAVVSGVSCVVGALIPLIVLHSGDLFRPQGILLMVGMVILVVGLVLYGVAGHRRDREQLGDAAPVRQFEWGFGTGLAVCIFTGTLGSSINLGFAFSGGIIHTSLLLGGNSVTSTYAVWALLFAASFIPNLTYCSYLLFRNHGWSLYVGSRKGTEATICLGMALISFAGFVIYGIGAMTMGKYGTSLGWTLFVAVTIIASSLAGHLTGEWKGTSQKTRWLLTAAVVVILVSVAVLDLGGVV